MRIYICILTAIILLPFVFEEPAQAQWWGRRDREFIMPERDIFPSDSFTFCRVKYNSYYGGRGRGRGGSWATDFPEAEENFSIRLSELTTIEVNKDEYGNFKHVVTELTDPEIFKYPFLYMLQVEGLSFSDEEANKLRDYLLRGGFLLVDDFWGTPGLQNWEYEIGKVLPPDEFPMRDIPLEHELFHIVFEIKEVPQIPGIGYWQNSGGDTSEVRYRDPNPDVSLKGIWDKQGRLMVVVNHNSDLGDGWEEEAKNPQYFEEFSKRKAYPLGINIVVYAMTH